jgi:hypothetical protein
MVTRVGFDRTPIDTVVLTGVAGRAEKQRGIGLRRGLN